MLNYVKICSIVVKMTLSILLGIRCGNWVDIFFQIEPIGILVGLFIGIGIGFKILFEVSKKYFKDKLIK